MHYRRNFMHHTATSPFHSKSDHVSWDELMEREEERQKDPVRIAHFQNLAVHAARFTMPNVRLSKQL